MTLDRLKLENHYDDDEYLESRGLFLSAFKKISFIKLSNSIIESSCRPWGIPVKSLDAIHLASALQWKQSEEKSLVFLTHDKRHWECGEIQWVRRHWSLESLR